jgi:hypothetical protein
MKFILFILAISCFSFRLLIFYPEMASRYGFSEYKPPEDIPDTKTNPPDPP